VLAVAAAVVLAGHRSVASSAEWAADVPRVLAALGARGDPLSGAWQTPSAATVRRVLARIDADLGLPTPPRRSRSATGSVRPPAAAGTTETIYAVTSLVLGTASPAQLADYLHGRWRVETSRPRRG
jgi:hypothetical protein